MYLRNQIKFDHFEKITVGRIGSLIRNDFSGSGSDGIQIHNTDYQFISGFIEARSSTYDNIERAKTLLNTEVY